MRAGAANLALFTPDSRRGMWPLVLRSGDYAHLRPPPAPSGDCVLGRGTNDEPSQNFSSSDAVAAELRHHKRRSPICFSSLTAAHGQLGRTFFDMMDVHTVRLAGRTDGDVRRGSGRAPAPSRTRFRRRPVLGPRGSLARLDPSRRPSTLSRPRRALSAAFWASARACVRRRPAHLSGRRPARDADR